MVILGWLFVYYANQNRDVVTSRFRNMYITLYTHLSRELYIPDLYEAIGRKLSELSGRINRGMRWM